MSTWGDPCSEEMLKRWKPDLISHNWNPQYDPFVLFSLSFSRDNNVFPAVECMAELRFILTQSVLIQDSRPSKLHHWVTAGLWPYDVSAQHEGSKKKPRTKTEFGLSKKYWRLRSSHVDPLLTHEIVCQIEKIDRSVCATRKCHKGSSLLPRTCSQLHRPRHKLWWKALLGSGAVRWYRVGDTSPVRPHDTFFLRFLLGPKLGHKQMGVYRWRVASHISLVDQRKAQFIRPQWKVWCRMRST